ncbi:hypothetical protein [Hymenobacter glacieicola]|nr:hypothetical protein [Hymenobacter glacieicola]
MLNFTRSLSWLARLSACLLWAALLFRPQASRGATPSTQALPSLA